MTEKVKVTFVCTGNYYRSRFAESYFNYLCDILKLNYVADSYGLAIHFADELAEEHGEISPFSKERMEKIGIPERYFLRDRKSLIKDAIENSDVIIAMDKEEHTPMIMEQFPSYINQFNFFEVKDVFDWEPKQTLDETQKMVEMMINDIMNENDINIFS